MDVATRAPYGTVEHYAGLLRSNELAIDTVTLQLINDLANHPVHEGGQDGSRLDRIRNVLAAAELVRAELRAAGR